MKDQSEVAQPLYNAILILGPPGAGKGTLGTSLGKVSNHFHLSSGDIFRKISATSPTGKIYHSYADKGFLLPDNIAITLWHDYLEGLISTHRYFPEKQFLLLDGIPRTLDQAIILGRYLKVLHIILLETEEREELRRRIEQRSLVEHRLDDNDKGTFSTRIELYSEENRKLLTHYPASLISRFNAAQKPLKVLRDVLNRIGDLLA